jgi:hypothetical protein
MEEDRPAEPQPAKIQSFLGISAAELAGVSVEELTNNKTAITMLVHYYKQFSDENASLKQDVNSLQTYFGGYREKTTNARIGAIMLALSNILIGFAVNLLTNANTVPGLFLLVPGICTTGVGLYFSLKKVD